VRDSQPVRVGNGCGEPYAIAVSLDLVTDGRLSAADLGVYLRCRWLLEICGPYNELDWLIRELRMPDAETHDSFRRLVDLGYLGTFGADDYERHTASEVSQRVHDAIEATVDDLTPAERVGVARFADLVDRRRDRAIEASMPPDLSGHGD